MVDADPGFGRVAFIDTRGRNAMRRVVMSAAAAVTVGATAVVSAPAALAEEPSGVSRVSVAYDGEPAGDSSHYPVVSGDGRVVAFGSNAANIVRQDFNGVFDTFVRDLSSGVSTRVSVASDGTAADAASYGAALSYDGRFVAFYSGARNLVPGDTNGAADVFVHDRQTGVTSRVSVATDGTEGNGASQNPQISADGRWVTFSTTATNLAPGAAGTKSKVLLHDRETGVTTEVSVRPDGTSGTEESRLPSISADGRYVGFISSDRLIVPSPRFIATSVYVRDVQSGTTVRVNATSLSSLGYAIPKVGTPALLSPDGRYVTIFTDTTMVAEDTNRVADAYRIEVATGAVTRVSVGADGVQADKASGLTITGAPMSDDGRYVAFDSEATNLVAGDANGVRDIFVRDTVEGTTTLVSSGEAPNTRGSYYPAISGDGSVVVFTTDGALTPEDTNLRNDVYLARRAA
jgi:Tol biopolymer transport system component